MERKNKIIIIVILILVLLAIGLGYLIVNQSHQVRAEALALETMKAQEEIIAERQDTIDKADSLVKGYYYDEAIAELKAINPLLEVTEQELTYFDQKVIKQMDQVSAENIGTKIKEIQDLKASLVKYEGQVHHLFFHSLIVNTDLAFDNVGRNPNGYNMWMVTVSEFKKMLPELRDRGYILYNLSDYIEPDPTNAGAIKLKDIMVPQGKTPLVISIDDVSYYDYMQPDGFAERLVAGEDGKIYTEIVSADGTKALTRDGDVMPILDDFVETNPGFSYRGAKGTIALTGFEGALGYDFTNERDPVKKTELIAEAKKTADLLKKNGWLFASHSYTHNQYFRDGTMTLDKMKYDLDRWISNIEPVVGKTNIYISPFGVRYKNSNQAFRYLVQSGFNIFCPVGNERKIFFNGDNIVMGRIDIDGYSMNTRKDELNNYYFNVDNVYDPARPKLIY
jgi:peptidoglycan/xylan/chitin deacetylase (PgdA/CDA1 family)